MCRLRRRIIFSSIIRFLFYKPKGICYRKILYMFKNIEEISIAAKRRSLTPNS